MTVESWSWTVDEFRCWEDVKALAGQVHLGDCEVGPGRYTTSQGDVKGPALVHDVVVQGTMGAPYITIAGCMVWYEGGPPARMPLTVPPGESLLCHRVSWSIITYEVITLAKLQFGKYAGQDIEQVPADYLAWLKSQAEDRIKEVDVELERRAALERPATPMIDEILAAGFKALAKRYHPDTGGDPSKFHELKTANEQLKAVLAEIHAASPKGAA